MMMAIYKTCHKKKQTCQFGLTDIAMQSVGERHSEEFKQSVVSKCKHIYHENFVIELTITICMHVHIHKVQTRKILVLNHYHESYSRQNLLMVAYSHG